jgi:serine/threonine-protein kinase
VSLRILVDALLGLHAAHEHVDDDGQALHLVHRDFSPQNILVGTDGIARLTDFGIAKATSSSSNTLAGQIKGKLSYLAPEQVRADKVDRRCDVWAAGVIAWELIAGQKLFVDVHSPTRLHHDPPRLKTVVNDIDDALDEVVWRALQVNREQRLATARLFARELAVASGPGGLADHEEVAEYVLRLTGPKLAERKATLDEARRRRASSMPQVAIRQTPGALQPVRVPLPSLPAAPPHADSDANLDFDVEVEVEIAASTHLRAAAPSAPTASSPPASPGLLSSEAAKAGGAPSEERRSPLVTEPPVDLPLSTLAGVGRRLYKSARQSKLGRVPLIVLVGGGIIMVVVLAVMVRAVGSAPDPQASTARDKTVPSMLASTQLPEIRPSGSPAAPSAPAPAEPAAAFPLLLRIMANAPIASVRIADRIIEAVVPAPELGIELMDEEVGAELRLLATSQDGRMASAMAPSGARELTVTFAASRRTVPKSAPAPRATPGPPHARPLSRTGR